MKKKIEKSKSTKSLPKLTKMKYTITKHVIKDRDGVDREIVRKRMNVPSTKKITTKSKNGTIRDYFNIDYFLTEAKLLLFSIFFFITERNLGKGYSSNNYVLRDWEVNGKGFVWMRRNKNELDKYIKSMRAEWYTEGYIVKDYIMYDATKGAGDNIVGYFIALKTSYEFASANFDNINKLIFDEFISRNGYLKEEYQIFADFIKTIERDDDLVIIFNGNSITQNNPYLVKFAIWGTDREVEDTENRMYVYQPVKGDYVVPIDEDSTSYIFAKQDEKILNYMLFNEYSFDDTELIKDISKIKIEWIFNLQLNKKQFKYGIGEDNKWYFDDGFADGVIVYSLTTKDSVEDGLINAPYDLVNFVRQWTTHLKNKNCFFGSFDAKDFIIEFLIRIEGNINR